MPSRTEMRAVREQWRELLQLYDFEDRTIRDFLRYFDFFAFFGLQVVPRLPRPTAGETKAMFDVLLGKRGWI